MRRPLFEQLEKLARQRNMSRSQLVAEAVEEYIRRQESRELIEKINAAYDEATPDELDLLRAMRRRQRRILEAEW